MAFGHGFTGLVVALIVSLSSGVAFIICLREFTREIFARTPRLEKSLRRNRNVLFDNGGEFVIEDELFQQVMQEQAAAHTPNSRQWRDPTSYLFTVAFLGLIAAAGFVAGLSHFA